MLRADILGTMTPFFTIVVTTYNRARLVTRCIDSCLAQTFEDFELVVVDDGSSDDTREFLPERYGADPRFHLVSHEANRGINPSRYTGAKAARGEWVVVFDSDDEMAPNALERYREVIATLPPGVGAVRSRLIRESGKVTPSFVPDGPYDYEGRIRWAEAEGGEDAARCLKRSVLEVAPYIADRRGAMETLFELNLAKATESLCVEDVLGTVHEDAPDSWLRASGAKHVIPRLEREAPDMLWMATTVLREHGDALKRWGPHQYLTQLRIAAMQSFLLGKRRDGAKFARQALRRAPFDAQVWATLLLGLVGPGVVARGAVAFRRFR
jgi:hypothetical protein